MVSTVGQGSPGSFEGLEDRSWACRLEMAGLLSTRILSSAEISEPRSSEKDRLLLQEKPWNGGRGMAAAVRDYLFMCPCEGCSPAELGGWAKLLLLHQGCLFPRGTQKNARKCINLHVKHGAF